jgi:hypothetical protein
MICFGLIASTRCCFWAKNLGCFSNNPELVKTGLWCLNVRPISIGYQSNEQTNNRQFSYLFDCDVHGSIANECSYRTVERVINFDVGNI